jgi:hypothetical protein
MLYETAVLTTITFLQCLVYPLHDCIPHATFSPPAYRNTKCLRNFSDEDVAKNVLLTDDADHNTNDNSN